MQAVCTKSNKKRQKKLDHYEPELIAEQTIYDNTFESTTKATIFI